MSENSCGRERRGKGKATEWTLSLGKEARARIWIPGVGREGTLHRLRLNQSHCSMPASPTPSPAQLPAQMPVPLASSTCCGEEGDEDVGNGDTLLPSALLPRRSAPLACPEVATRVRRSGSQVQQGTAVPSPPLLTLCPTPAPHMRLQLLARSLCISLSVPVPRSGRPAS